MSVKLRLYQEGNIRINGFQTTEWIDSNPSFTTPAYKEPFILRKNGYGIADGFSRVAVPADFGQLLVNPLIALDVKGPFTVYTTPVVGDVLRVQAENFPQWVTTTLINGQSYTLTGDGYMEFVISGVQPFRGKQTGDAPPSVTGHAVTVSNYQFSDEDIGRQLVLSGFNNGPNNVTSTILSTFAGQATVDNVVPFVTESGTSSATWTFNRFLVNSNKPFPRIEGSFPWQVRSTATSTIIVNSPMGFVMRQNPDLVEFRDDRLTMINATMDIAQDHFTLVKSYLSSLQQQLSQVDTAFGSVGPYDFGP